MFVPTAGEVAILVKQRRTLNAKFEKGGHDIRPLRDPDIGCGAADRRAVKKGYAAAQFMPDARVDREFAARKPTTPIADERELRAHVQFRAVVLRAIPVDRLHIDAQVFVQAARS